MSEILAGFAALFQFIKDQLDAGRISDEEARAMAMKVGYQISESETDEELAEYLKAFEDGD